MSGAGEGMVAVVQNLRNAGLTVTLLDGSRNQFSLVPNSVQVQPQTPKPQCHVHLHHQNSSAGTDSTIRCDSSAQATDGRYASMYQTTHGNVEPTSPPCHVTEFPPQRAELSPGNGNFEVGGLGSGESFRGPIKLPPGNYRGGLNWVDRGSVCAARPSQPIDHFANSLRKYPLSPDRSSEVFERIVTYSSHAKNLSRHPKKEMSPTRGTDYEAHQACSERCPRRARHEEMRRSRDEYPTRDLRLRRDEYDRRPYSRNYEMRCVRDISRNKDADRPDDSSCRNNTREDSNSPSCQRQFIGNGSTNSVNTEAQAVVQMVSKEVATVPRSAAVKRNVAVPRSASASTVGIPEGAVSNQASLHQMEQNTNKIVSFKSVQTTSSSIELNFNTQNHLTTRNCKSEDDLKRKHFQEGIIELIGHLAVANAKSNENILKDMWVKLHRVLKTVEQQNCRDRCLINMGSKVKETPNLMPTRYDMSTAKDWSRKRIKKWAEMDVYHAALPPFKIVNIEDRFEHIVRNWVTTLPIKSHDLTGRSVDIVQISNELVRKLLNLLRAKAKIDGEVLKRKVINAISQDLIKNTELCKRNIVLSSVNELVCNLRDAAPNMFRKLAITNNHKRHRPNTIYRHLHSTEAHTKQWVSNICVKFFDKFNLNLCSEYINDITTGLADILINIIYDGYNVNDEFVTKDIMWFLSDYDLEESQSKELATELLNEMKLRTSFQAKCGNRNFIVCVNTCNSIKRHPVPFFGESANSNVYVEDLYDQIDKWLDDLPVEIFKRINEETRSAAVHDLAADIIDRQKYLEFNSSKTTDENELEYLKYQIYKWMNKVEGKENINIVEYASDLMDKIRDISAPKLMLMNPNVLNIEVRNMFNNSATCNTTKENFKESDNINSGNNINRRQSILKTKDVKNQTEEEQSEKLSQSCTTQCNTQKSRMTIQQLNDEYDEYVQNWIKKIPIPASSTQEQELAEKLRTDIYNGIWKALTKLKFDPVTFHNPFYYQDLLDIELESLFSILPKSDELEAEKPVLKAQLLEHTTNTNEKLIKLAEPAAFKQALVENVANNIRRNYNYDSNDPIKLHEDLQILSIVEDYIVLTNYDESNKVKANAFRQKLLRNVEAFVEQLKRTHGKELKDIDIGIYMNDIIEALYNVPIPSDDSLKQEADEILLGIEIEHWFNDLPLVPNDEYFEKLRRKRLRESLTKKIVDMDKSNSGPSEVENLLKTEIVKFLEKVPLEPKEATNINFMTDELLNRITNKKREQGTRRRSVAFQQPLTYNEFKFSRELPHCSGLSISNDQSKSNVSSTPVKYHPNPTFNQNNNNSSMIGGGMLYNPPAFNATIEPSHDYNTFEENRPLSSSMFSLPSNIYGNAQYSNYSPGRFNLGAPIQRPHSAAPYNASESAWASLEQVPIPPELRKILMEERSPQLVKSFTYIDTQPINQSNHIEQQAMQGSCYVENKIENISQLPQIIQEQISRKNEAAIGRISNASNYSKQPVMHGYSAQNQVENTSQLPYVNIGINGRVPIVSQYSEEPIMQGSCCVHNSVENTSRLPHIIQDQISRINQAAVGHVTNASNLTNHASLVTDMNHLPAGGFTTQRSQILNQTNTNSIPASLARNVFNQTNANRSNEISNNLIQSNLVFDRSNTHRSNEVCSQTNNRVLFTDTTSVQPPGQNVSIRLAERPFTPRATQYLQHSLQNTHDVANLIPTLTPQQNISITAPAVATNVKVTPQYTQQAAVQIPEVSEPQQMVDQKPNQVQPSGSSYGQPQGFSTPHQENIQRSPPRISRKTHDPQRFRSGTARRRLELDDSDESDEDCPCMTRFKRRSCEDWDHPCFYPFPYPYPYFF